MRVLGNILTPRSMSTNVFFVNASLPKLLDVANSNFVPE